MASPRTPNTATAIGATAAANQQSASIQSTITLPFEIVRQLQELANCVRESKNGDELKKIFSEILKQIPSDESDAPLSAYNLDTLPLLNIRKAIPAVIMTLNAEQHKFPDAKNLMNKLTTLSVNLRYYMDQSSRSSIQVVTPISIDEPATVMNHLDTKHNAKSLKPLFDTAGNTVGYHFDPHNNNELKDRMKNTASAIAQSAALMTAENAPRGPSQNSYAASEAREDTEVQRTDVVIAKIIEKEVKELDETPVTESLKKNDAIKKLIKPLSNVKLFVRLWEASAKKNMGITPAELSEAVIVSSNKSLLLKSNDILGNISAALGTSGTSQLLATCRGSMRLFQNQLSDAYKGKRPLFEKLLGHIAHGEQDEAEELLEGYGVRVKTQDVKPEPDKLYFNLTAQGQLQYSLTTSEGKCYNERVITQEDLNKIIEKIGPKDQKLTLSDNPLTAEALKKLKPYLLAITAERGHTIPQKNRCLLLMKGNVTTYAEDTYEDVSPLELAYAEDDDDMFKMLLPYLDKFSEDNKVAILNQVKAKFAESKEEKSYDFTALVAAITKNTNVEEALELFRRDFAPKVIRSGKQSTRITQALLKAMEIYNANYDPWAGDQCSLFWCKVIGFLERRLSACYAQAFCQGLYNVTEGKQPLLRSLRLDDGSLFFARPLSERSGLGFDFGVYSASALVGIERLGVVVACRGLQILCRTKTSVFRELTRWRCDQSKKSMCLIM